ncbi:MAG: DNA polymerase IV [Methanomethylophilus sp.]|nr:DNA polymerase IV [Methanomethylophilus sp.]
MTGRDRIIIHVDMDAFYASVEIRDNPALKGKPVIIGALPDQRGVVSTCSYEARSFGVRSGMNIKEAYRLCPQGVYIHPDFEKYKAVSEQLHGIWDSYATVSEPIAFDESFLDVTATAGNFDRAAEMAREIKRRTREEVGLTCSVGVAYCMSAAKIASEEMKPDGFFEIRTREEFVELMSGREVRELFSVGPRTAERLNDLGITTVSDIRDHAKDVVRAFGKHGSFLVGLADGIDDREVTPYRPEDAKSVSRELTFQEDVSDYVLIRDVILLLALSVEERASRYGLNCYGISVMITYSDMKSITRTRTGVSDDSAITIAKEAWKMMENLGKRPVRLIGVGVFNFAAKKVRQMTLDPEEEEIPAEEELAYFLEKMHKRYRFDFAKNREWMLRVDRMHGVAEHMRIQRNKTLSKHGHSQ